MKYLAIALASAALTGAQTPGISIRPATPGLGMEAHTGAGNPAVPSGRFGAPVLGYIAGPGPLDVRMVLGTAKGAQMGSLLTLPPGVKHVSIPPREQYLLLENKATDALSVWSPTNGAPEGFAIIGALAHPDMVEFSARGDAAALYNKPADQLQVVMGLPAEPVLSSQPGVGKWGQAVSFALSDDGAIVVASLADGTAVVSLHAAAWQRLPAAYGARALIFVPRTHDLIVSDANQQTLTLVSHLTESTQASRILAHEVAAERLAVNKEGSVLLAASSSQSKAWTVDLKTFTPALVSSSPIDTLLPLRDGHTFLLSSPGMALLNVALEGDNATGFVPVAR